MVIVVISCCFCYLQNQNIVQGEKVSLLRFRLLRRFGYPDHVYPYHVYMVYTYITLYYIYYILNIDFLWCLSISFAGAEWRYERCLLMSFDQYLNAHEGNQFPNELCNLNLSSNQLQRSALAARDPTLLAKAGIKPCDSSHSSISSH